MRDWDTFLFAVQSAALLVFTLVLTMAAVVLTIHGQRAITVLLPDIPIPFL
jgi:hypothetical protein